MIKKLRRKFILIASAAILLVLAIVLIIVNGLSYYSNYSEAMSIVDFIAENSGRMPDDDRKGDFNFHMTRELPYETRYFSVVINSEEQLVLTDYEHISSVTDEEAQLVRELTSANSTNGSLKTNDSCYIYRTKAITAEELEQLVEEKRYASSSEMDIDTNADYKLAVFMDVTNRMYRVRTLCIMSILSGIACYVVFVLLVSAFSKRAVQPFIENYEKQKQFITNAGHELKTPLAIISANTEVMEAMDGKTEWTQSTMKQVNRLSGLISDLITLARLEESSETQESMQEDIDISAKTDEIASSFRPVIEQQGKFLETDIESGIKIKGSEKPVHELISILLDNAAKYCDDEGTVKVELKQQRKQVVLTVSNSYKEGANVDHSRFFDRFYRGDSSHNSERSGYGIGLSMAESIVKMHKGKIYAYHSEGKTCFRVVI